MQSQNKLFEDLARVMSGAAGTLAGMGREMETNIRDRMREFVGGLDLVQRDEFEAVKAMAANARAEVDELKAQLASMRGDATPVVADAPAEFDPTAEMARSAATDQVNSSEAHPS